MFKQVVLVALFAVVTFGLTEDNFENFGPAAVRSPRESNNATDNTTNTNDETHDMVKLIDEMCFKKFKTMEDDDDGRTRRAAHLVKPCIQAANNECNITSSRTRRAGHTVCISTAIKKIEVQDFDELINKRCTSAFTEQSRTRRAAHALKKCKANADDLCEGKKSTHRGRRAGHSACIDLAISKTKDELKSTAPTPDAPTTEATSTVTSGKSNETKTANNETATVVTATVTYTLGQVEEDLAKMTADERDALKKKIEEETRKNLQGSTVKVEFKKNNDGSWTATVTVTYTDGTDQKTANNAVEGQTKTELTYTVGGEEKTVTVDYTTILSPTNPNSSAATVLSTVATVVVATITALF